MNVRRFKHIDWNVGNKVSILLWNLIIWNDWLTDWLKSMTNMRNITFCTADFPLFSVGWDWHMSDNTFHVFNLCSDWMDVVINVFLYVIIQNCPNYVMKKKDWNIQKESITVNVYKRLIDMICRWRNLLATSFRSLRSLNTSCIIMWSFILPILTILWL